MTSPQLVGRLPQMTQVLCRRVREDGAILEIRGKRIMQTHRPEPNAELQQRFEPLRVIFALLALLLGAIASLQL